MNTCIILFFQVLKLSGDKILSSRLIIDAMGNFSPIVKQVRKIFLLIVASKQIVWFSSCFHKGVFTCFMKYRHTFPFACAPSFIFVRVFTLHMNCRWAKIGQIFCCMQDTFTCACRFTFYHHFTCMQVMQHLFNK